MSLAYKCLDAISAHLGLVMNYLWETFWARPHPAAFGPEDTLRIVPAS